MTDTQRKLRETIETEDGFLCWTWNRDGTKLIRVFIPKN